MGDAHAAQGDSELDGTAVETSITGRIKVTLHKKASLPKLVQVRAEGQQAAAGNMHTIRAHRPLSQLLRPAVRTVLPDASSHL